MGVVFISLPQVEAAIAVNGSLFNALPVSVTFRDVSTSSNFTVVRGPANRWYVQNVDLDSLQKICAAK